MNQKAMLTSLRTFTSSDHPYGNNEGKEVLRKLSEFVEQNASCHVFGISLEGITATDASFPRESVVTLAKQLRGEKGFYLTHLVNRDLIDNWSYAASAKDQPLVIWNDSNFEIIGPDLSKSTRDLVEYVLERGSVLTSQVAAELGLSVPNASTRLKNLVTQGYLLRSEDAAPTGGIEFKYSAIK
jgi:Winged helix-turn-helix DNA-binding